MLIPISTDYRMSRTPWMNYALIAANVLLYLWGYNGASTAGNLRIGPWMLHPDSPQLVQFFSSMFLHGGLLHLIGNMVFLWVFGNAVNDRFGAAGYLAFYLAGGVLAGVGYVLLSPLAPVLGASGAISGVSGAYLVLFPRVRVTLLVFLVFTFFPFELSSLYFLAFQFGWNLLMSTNSQISGTQASGVAYVAHSSGYVYGIAIAALLLAFRVLPRQPFDLLNLFRTHQRRQRYQRMTGAGWDPFGQARRQGDEDEGRWVDARVLETTTPNTPAARELILRRKIAQALAARNLQEASRQYAQLVAMEPQATLARPQQLDVANQLMADQDYAAAAVAYENFVRVYGDYEHIADIYLMLGLIYCRYVRKDEMALSYLEKAIARMSDPRKVALAQADLAEVRSRLGQ